MARHPLIALIVLGRPRDPVPWHSRCRRRRHGAQATPHPHARFCKSLRSRPHHCLGGPQPRPTHLAQPAQRSPPRESRSIERSAGGQPDAEGQDETEGCAWRSYAFLEWGILRCFDGECRDIQRYAPSMASSQTPSKMKGPEIRASSPDLEASNLASGRRA